MDIDSERASSVKRWSGSIVGCLAEERDSRYSYRDYFVFAGIVFQCRSKERSTNTIERALGIDFGAGAAGHSSFGRAGRQQRWGGRKPNR